MITSNKALTEKYKISTTVFVLPVELGSFKSNDIVTHINRKTVFTTIAYRNGPFDLISDNAAA